MKEAVLKNFAISQENTCVEARLFNKVAGHQFCIFFCIVLQKIPTQAFSCEIAKFLRTPMFVECHTRTHKCLIFLNFQDLSYELQSFPHMIVFQSPKLRMRMDRMCYLN